MHRRTEARQRRDPSPAMIDAVEELTTGDADRLRVRRHVLRQITGRRRPPAPGHDARAPPRPRPDDPTPAPRPRPRAPTACHACASHETDAPVADPTSRRRAAANNTTPASTTTTGMTITRGFDGGFATCALSELEEQTRRSTGATKLKPGPRKNEPMMTSTAQNMRKMVNSEIANLRSSGLLRRVLVDVGRQDQR